MLLEKINRHSKCLKGPKQSLHGKDCLMEKSTSYLLRTGTNGIVYPDGDCYLDGLFSRANKIFMT
jgi:hypothetical protein